MKLMGIRALFPEAKTTKRNLAHKVYPYLLRDLEVIEINQVWCTDITYIPKRKGFCILLRLWTGIPEKSSPGDDQTAWKQALASKHSKKLATHGRPDIFNSENFTRVLKNEGIKISMDGKASWIDNLFIERLWRSLKYEEVYLKAYNSVAEGKKNIGDWLAFYNQDRRHSSLNRMTPDQVYYKLPSGLPEAV